MPFKHTLNIDLESFSSADLKKCGMYRYVESPDFEILMIAYSVDGGEVEIMDLVNFPELGGEYDWFVTALTDPTYKKIAYNAQFERICFEKYLGHSMPPEQWECTMIKGAMLGLPMGLASIASVLQTDVQKDFAGAALIRYFCLPCKPTKTNEGRTRNLPHHAPEKWEAFKSYCMDDVRSEMAVGAKIAFFEIPEKEKRLWDLDQWINGYGVLVDKKFVRQAIEMDAIVKEQLTREAVELTGLENPNSVSKLLGWLSQETGDELTTLRKADVPVMLNAYDDAKVTRVLEIRQEMAKTSVSKYLAMARSVCADGRVRGLFQFAGARTMRWCVAENTPVLVVDGSLKPYYKPIQDVLDTDLVWDGTDWVAHEGVVFSGDKDVIEWDGITATPEHYVFISPEKSVTLEYARENKIALWKGNSPFTV